MRADRDAVAHMMATLEEYADDSELLAAAARIGAQPTVKRLTDEQASEE